jgi:hypothetical protein
MCAYLQCIFTTEKYITMCAGEGLDSQMYPLVPCEIELSIERLRALIAEEWKGWWFVSTACRLNFPPSVFPTWILLSSVRTVTVLGECSKSLAHYFVRCPSSILGNRMSDVEGAF